MGEAAVATLVVRADGHVRLRAADAHGFAWVPGSRASLLYATSGLYGEGGLFLWTPAGKRALVKIRRPRDETFTLVDATASGRNVNVRYLYRKAEETVAKDRLRTVLVRLRPGE